MLSYCGIATRVMAGVEQE